MSAYSDRQYISYDPFAGEMDAEIKLRKVRMVTTRKPHECYGDPDRNGHKIPAGSRARFESALVDGDYWGRYYTCVVCMDKWMREMGVNPEAASA